MADVIHLMPRWTQQEWMAEAVCSGQTEHFFPPHGEQADARAVREIRAAAICRTCPVILECRDDARRHREQGFWGGENDEQRIEHRRRGNPRTRPAAVHPQVAASG
jgi:WhiB family redox-sensing transcriptional regulator